MREETTTRTLYKYDELSDKAKLAAREWFAQGVFDYEWWECTYEDAKTIGLKITEFDIYRNMIDGKLLLSVPEICKAIEANHGENTETYKLVQNYKNVKNDDDEGEVNEFRIALLEEYFSMLKLEAEYMESKENLEEGIIANEYEFLENGKCA